MAQLVKCPECRIPVELPGVIKPKERFYCPDCDTRLKVDNEPPPKRSKPKSKPKRKRKKPEPQPFWKTKMGKVLSGIGFIVLGAVMIGAAVTMDLDKPIKYIIGGILAILVGCGSCGYGMFADEDGESSDSDDEGGGD